jgi:multiple sugar transport system permease protein
MPGSRSWSARKLNERLFALALVLPAIAMLSFTIGIPIIDVIRMSFLNYSLVKLKEVSWNRFQNYLALFRNAEFALTFLRTLYFVFISVALQFLCGLVCALILNQRIFGGALIKGALFLPWTIPMLIVGVVWMWIYQPQYGILTYIVHDVLHLTRTAINWAGQMNTAMPSVIAAAVWRNTPFMIVMLTAGLQTVPNDLLEAAVIDGANAAQKFWRVTLPCIMSVVKTVTLTSIIVNFQMFVLFFVITGGGPVHATRTLTVATYETAFMAYDFGRAAAVGVVWLLFLILFSTAYNRLLSRTEAYA